MPLLGTGPEFSRPESTLGGRSTTDSDGSGKRYFLYIPRAGVPGISVEGQGWVAQESYIVVVAGSASLRGRPGLGTGSRPTF